jgi:2-desacetyl-2-hydroxyethyl bacteriochlorophyllide A dehydrogenase
MTGRTIVKAQSIYFLAPGKAEIREVGVSDPASDQIQVKCLANGICMAETSIFTGAEPAQFPCLVGHEGIGVVVKVGDNVENVKEGDFVCCGPWSSVQNMDARRAHKFTIKPDDPAIYLTEPVSCVVTALYAYDITPGDRVLVMGAGFMGLLNVQGLAHYPLAELVVTEVKAHNLELAREFGATEVIHVGTPEGNARLEEFKSQPFDLVVEAAGVEATVQQASLFARNGGRLAIFAWHHTPRSLDLGVWHLRGLKVPNVAPNIGTDHNTSSMARAIRLLERGVFDLSQLVTHRHPASQVQEAMELSVERPQEYIKGVLIFDD